MNEPRLLVLALAPFPDALQAVEPLAARRRARPGESVTFAGPPGACDIARALGLSDACWDVGPTRRESKALSLYRTGVLLTRVRRGRFDEVVDLFPHLRSLAAAKLATPRRSRADAAFVEAVFRIRAKAPGGYDPRERIARLLEVDPDRREAAVDFMPDLESDRWIERALAATGYHGGEPVIVVHASGVWPSDRFVDAAGRLRSALGARVVFIDTPREGKDAHTLAATLGGSVLGVGAPPAGRYLAAIARASVVLTDDAGTAQIATYLGAPAVLAAGELTAEAAFDAACKLVRRERTGALFRT